MCLLAAVWPGDEQVWRRKWRTGWTLPPAPLANYMLGIDGTLHWASLAKQNIHSFVGAYLFVLPYVADVSVISTTCQFWQQFDNIAATFLAKSAEKIDNTPPLSYHPLKVYVGWMAETH